MLEVYAVELEAASKEEESGGDFSEQLAWEAGKSVDEKEGETAIQNELADQNMFTMLSSS